MKHVLILTSLLFGACVGSEIPGPPVQPKPDAPDEPIFEDAPAPPPDMGPAAGCVDRDPAPLPPFIHTGNGGIAGTAAGDPRGCTATNCHRYGLTADGAPDFLLGGTVYKKGTTEPDAGATILIFPDGSPTTPLTLKTDQAGNFYVRATGANTALGFTGQVLPAAAGATVCPDLTRGHLTGKIRTGTTPGNAGNCNACHTLPGDGGTVSAIYVK